MKIWASSRQISAKSLGCKRIQENDHALVVDMCARKKFRMAKTVQPEVESPVTPSNMSPVVHAVFSTACSLEPAWS